MDEKNENSDFQDLRTKAEELRQYQTEARAMASANRPLREHEKAALAAELKAGETQRKTAFANRVLGTFVE